MNSVNTLGLKLEYLTNATEKPELHGDSYVAGQGHRTVSLPNTY